MIRRQRRPYMTLILVFLILILFIFLLSPSEAKQAKRVVDTFYQYEQDAQFSSSWQLLHSSVQEQFSQSSYIQDRAHVFMGHFGSETFDYSLNSPKKISNYSLTNHPEETVNGYKIEVEQNYDSKYGLLKITQTVIVLKENNTWKLLWK
ncbi:hypothetical protein AJ85_16415 [Alkalihalobacillus alcalophilus ATCC 27647 = CGMCC 1.3604]|uniref:DUF4878 domain-containing protein n=1 Tax=Alkalihalobacillus alcalophilus ATCC 27647 = CGMCC 1.3604 TaxID=1218173 RepID=A0A094WPT4_ALKAL|nr:hypothetical protein [Alkalihalobacillus alcalophilus]KGA98043.1 hypothetical protein BALCAV_0206460 [Alkalihalobacillus alcalophilus ATCC 27647 = CGMCC 1.3604]MED1561898.1 hypothetical protein [Alkalihalobacillus alcalophilus]THG89581.1 hypothetical protein AJ85_16415 [Alkalihalobacillus alcalophilus ATCC 27647 = CGMCC 1.3604]